MKKRPSGTSFLSLSWSASSRLSSIQVRKRPKISSRIFYTTTRFVRLSRYFIKILSSSLGWLWSAPSLLRLAYSFLVLDRIKGSAWMDLLIPQKHDPKCQERKGMAGWRLMASSFTDVVLGYISVDIRINDRAAGEDLYMTTMIAGSVGIKFEGKWSTCRFIRFRHSSQWLVCLWEAR